MEINFYKPRFKEIFTAVITVCKKLSANAAAVFYAITQPRTMVEMVEVRCNYGFASTTDRRFNHTISTAVPNYFYKNESFHEGSFLFLYLPIHLLKAFEKISPLKRFRMGCEKVQQIIEGTVFISPKHILRVILLPVKILLLCMAITTKLSAQTIGLTTPGTSTYPTTVVGDNAIRTGTVSITTNIVQAVNKFTVTGPMTLTSFSIYLSGSYNGHNMKFAVYPDNAGTPAGQALTGQTGAYIFNNTVNNWFTINLNTADYIYIPAAGTYWLCFLGDFSGGQVRRLNIQPDYYFTQSYASGYPATFSNSPILENAGTYSFYATGVKIKGYSKATKAVLGANQSFKSVSFYTHAAGNASLAIYNDASGAPSAKQWESGDITINATGQPKWTTVNINSGTPASLSLTAGNYWLVWQWNNKTIGPSYTAGVAGDGNFMNQLTYGAYPAGWSGGTSSVEKWSIYATVCTTPIAAVTNQSNISCFAANDGTITVEASGGTSPYTFSVDDGTTWLPPTGTDLRLFTDLLPNFAYRIKVKDSNGCISK